jgi:hypothetical protein
MPVNSGRPLEISSKDHSPIQTCNKWYPNHGQNYSKLSEVASGLLLIIVDYQKKTWRKWAMCFLEFFLQAIGRPSTCKSDPVLSSVLKLPPHLKQFSGAQSENQAKQVLFPEGFVRLKMPRSKASKLDLRKAFFGGGGEGWLHGFRCDWDGSWFYQGTQHTMFRERGLPASSASSFPVGAMTFWTLVMERGTTLSF